MRISRWCDGLLASLADTDSDLTKLGMEIFWCEKDFSTAGLYQWVWNIDGGFNWYAGVGGGLGSYSYDNGGAHYNDTFAFAAGDIGLEYNFDIPLLVSLDFRPEFGGNGYYKNNYGSDIALSVRYQF